MLKYEKEHEKAAFKELSGKEKLDHIWTYYKGFIIGGILLLLFGAWSLNHYIFNPPKQDSLAIGAVSSRYLDLMDTETSDTLNLMLPTLSDKRHQITIYDLLMTHDADQNSYYNSQRLFMMVAAESLDVLIGDEEMMKALGQADLLLNLEDFVTNEEKAHFDLIQVEVTTETDELGRVTGSKGPYPLILHIGTNPVLQHNFGSQDLYLGVVGNTPHPEAAHELLAYLMTLE